MSESFRPLNAKDVSGVVVMLVVAGFSVLALAFVALRAVWLALRCFFKHIDLTSREYVFFHTQLGVYATCLLTSNFLTAFSGLLSIAWAEKIGIQEGPVCTAQAILMQIGNFATAYFTIATGVHTFTTLVLRGRKRAWLGTSIVVLGIILSILIGTVPFAVTNQSTEQPLYGYDGFSCGVRRSYPLTQFLFHLLPIFLASVISAILYSLIFLTLRGTLVIRGGLKLNLDPQQRWSGRLGTYEEYHRFVSAIARTMLWYPFGYIVFLLPYSITRLMDLSGFTVSFAAHVFAYCCTFVLGLVNVCLLYNTLRVLGPVINGRISRTDLENGTSQEKIPPTIVHGSRSPVSPRLQSSHDSLRMLINKHGHTDSTDSTDMAANLQRPIATMSEIHRQMVASPEPAAPPRRLRALQLSTQSRESTRFSQRALPPPPRQPVERLLTVEEPPRTEPPRKLKGLHLRQNPSLSAVSPTPISPSGPSSASNYSEAEIPLTPPAPAPTVYFR